MGVLAILLSIETSLNDEVRDAVGLSKIIAIR